MDAKSQRQKRHDNIISVLNAAIKAVDLAKGASSATPATAAFTSVSILLTMIRDSMVNKANYVELGLTCANVCKVLDRGMRGKKLDDLSQSVCDAIEDLTKTVAGIRGNIIEKGGRNLLSRLVHAKGDQDAIVAWKSDLNMVLQIFNTELAINTHVMVSDLHRNALAGQEGTDNQHPSARPVISNAMESAVTSPGELPPPPLRSFFGRDEVVDKIVGLAENVAPLALIGPGGIGKTSIALAVLHHDRIKKRFGNNCRFIRCDQFPASTTHFLSRLSEVIGAGIENPKNLTPLRPFLSSREMILFLDNAESILDPQGTNAQEIYTMVKELSQFSNICLCLTSRISIIPPTCETLDIPTLSMEAAHDTFYSIYKNGEQPSLVDRILGELDFHPLSVTLLATIAHHNKWDTNRLSREWGRQRTDILHTQHNESLAATIELSLASPMFQELGSNARDLLEVIAFFPQGIDENNLDWLFPTLFNRTNIFDNFCVLSLTYRNNGFVTMLAPLRDYLYPKDPVSSLLLCATKDQYFHRLSIEVEPGHPGFKEAQWIISEDINVEHLLDVFTSIDPNLGGVWNTCAHFMEHLRWYKSRLLVLGPKIEGLPDDHPSKPECLFQLSQLFGSVGHYVEEKKRLTYALELWREQGNYYRVAQTLRFLTNVNRLLKLRKEGIQQAKEALAIYRWLNNIPGQAHSWQELGWILYDDGQLDIAKKAIFRAINYFNKSDQPLVCRCHSILGDIYHSQGKVKEAINHYEKALSIASPISWHKVQFWSHYSLAKLFFEKNRFNDADIQLNYAKSYATNATYLLGRAMELQAEFWYKQDKLKEAKSEALYAANLYKGLEVIRDLETCTALLQKIKEAMDKPVVSCK